MTARLSLIAEVMHSRGKETIGHHQIACSAGLLRQSGEAASEVECGAEIAIVELIDAQGPERAQPVGRVIGAPPVTGAPPVIGAPPVTGAPPVIGALPVIAAPPVTDAPSVVGATVRAAAAPAGTASRSLS